MIKRITVVYRDVSPHDTEIGARVTIDRRFVGSDTDRRAFANMLDRAIARAIAEWELSRD